MSSSPFRQLLGDRLALLPLPVQRIHTLARREVCAGRAEISAAEGLLARIACALLGLPRPGSDVPVEVEFEPLPDGGERWVRRFAERGYRSTVWAGTGAVAQLLREQFGWFDLYYTISLEPSGLVWRMVAWRLFGVPLPRFLMPRTLCIESGDGERYTFDIDVGLFPIGWLIRYRGWLAPREP